MEDPSSATHPPRLYNDNTKTTKPNITDIISETFPAFDHQKLVIEPFDNEAKRDAEFQEKLSEMLIDLMLDFHAWSTARPAHESDTTADQLEKEINAVLETEKEQGRSLLPHVTLVERTRQRLRDFVERIKAALATLTDL